MMVLGDLFLKKLNFEECQQKKIKVSNGAKIRNEQFPSIQRDKYRTFAKESVSLNISVIFSYEKMHKPC